MSLWSSLGSVGHRMAPKLGDIGEVVASTAEDRAKGRLAEANYAANRDIASANRATTNTNLDSTKMKQAMLLSLLSGAKDATVTPPAYIAARMPTVTGGPRISAMQGKDEIVQAMRQRILDSLFTGEHLPPQTDVPQANAYDHILSGVGQAAGIGGVLQKAGLFGKVGGAGAGVGGALAGGASAALPMSATLPSALTVGSTGIGSGVGSTAAGAGGVGGLGAAGAATLGIGAAVGAALLAWQKNRNSTKNAREDFAQSVGLRNTEQLYAKLQSLGPEGQRLANVGLNVIGKKDDAANKQWMSQVGALLDQTRGGMTPPVKGSGVLRGARA